MEEHHEKAKRNLLLEYKRLELTTSTEDHNLLGSLVGEKPTFVNYEKHGRGLRYFIRFIYFSLFFTLIGDYQSLICLQPNAPINVCPSINVESISQYIK